MVKATKFTYFNWRVGYFVLKQVSVLLSYPVSSFTSGFLREGVHSLVYVGCRDQVRVIMVLVVGSGVVSLYGAGEGLVLSEQLINTKI